MMERNLAWTANSTKLCDAADGMALNAFERAVRIGSTAR